MSQLMQADVQKRAVDDQIGEHEKNACIRIEKKKEEIN